MAKFILKYEESVETNGKTRYSTFTINETDNTADYDAFVHNWTNLYLSDKESYDINEDIYSDTHKEFSIWLTVGKTTYFRRITITEDILPF